jgi:dTDP-4-amino-4,6-dideoxygalactose transaminase
VQQAETIPFLDLGRESEALSSELVDALERVLANGRFILGPEVEAFEHEFAAYCGRLHGVGVGNGLDALQLIMRAAGVGRGDEVIVPAYTAVATWMAANLVGARPVGVDVDAETFTIDPQCVVEAVTERTRAIVAVHLFGQPAHMEPLVEIAREHRLLLVEDAAQAHGARYRGRVVGSLADAAAFSFYPTKNLGAFGDGGAVVTDDAALADRVRMLRTYGWRDRDESEILGVNTRLDELQAAMLRVKLGRLDAWNRLRRELADRYCERLREVDAIRLPHVAEDVEPVWHLFVVRDRRRDALAAALRDRGIGTLVHYSPLPHLTAAYRDEGWRAGAFPIAESLAAQALSLPLQPSLPVDAVDAVCAAICAHHA